MTDHDAYPDSLIRHVLTSVKTIAMVGASDNPARPSYLVYKYLRERGFRVIPVNPGKVGHDFLGETFVASLSDIRDPVDMVDIFRASEAAGPIVDEALGMSPPPKVIWMQLTVRNDAAAG
jgi:predicted CoA-binding protein